MVAWKHKSVLSDISFQWYSPCRAFYPRRCTTRWPSWLQLASVGSAFSPSRWFSHSDLKKHTSQSACRHWNLSLWSLLLTRPVASLKGELHYGDKNSGGAVCISPGPRVGGWSVFSVQQHHRLSQSTLFVSPGTSTCQVPQWAFLVQRARALSVAFHHK